MDGMRRPIRVFIVEDSAILLERLTAAVNAAGAEVVGHSSTAEEAIAAFARFQPDLLIIDIQLSSGTGFDVLRALQAPSQARAPTKMVLTNHATAEYRELSLQLGANAFFDKSSEVSKALEFIHRLAA